METKPSCGDEASVLDLLTSLSNQVLQFGSEDDFLRALAGELRERCGTDAVVVQVMDRCMRLRVTATEDGVAVSGPDEEREPCSPDDQRMWLQSDGMFCPDVYSCRFVKPKLREHLLKLGVKAAYVANGVREGEVYGQIVFGWKDAPEPSRVQAKLLQRVADFACTQFALFNVRKGAELDPLTGLLSWYGVRRRWDELDARRGAVLFVDVDSFRAIVQQRGRLAGEDVLRETARILLEESDGATHVGRFSEDAFVALLPGATADDVGRLGRRVAARVDALGDKWPPPKPHVTVGAALWPQQGSDLEALVASAEQQAYARKRTRLMLTMSTKVDPTQGRMPRNFLEGWLATSGDGIVITDADLKVVYVNPAYERMTGYTLAEWLGKTPSFVSSGKTPLRVYEQMWDHLNARGTWSGQVVNRHRSGREWVSYLTITRIVDRGGRLVGFIGVARNVTALQEDPSAHAPSWKVFEDVFTKETLAYALARAAQLHDVESGQHLERVREFTRLLAAAAAARGIEKFQSYEFRSAVSLASILHDIGKLAVPQAVLHKPGRLTAQEFELVKSHTYVGRDLLHSSFLRGSPSTPQSLFLEVAMDIAMYHHERWDGTGYPTGRAGKDIPIAARIVAIADVYDALRSPRPYKKPWRHADAVAHIRDQAGKHFDPELVELFLELSDEFNEVFERMPDGKCWDTA